MKWSKELESAISAVKEAGKLVAENFEKQIQVIRKDPKELVTKIDLQSQSIITEALKKDFPNYHFYTEETRQEQIIDGLTWVIDPIDGTHNYIAGLDNVGISVALVSEEEFYIGVLYFPIKSIIIYAVKGQGCFCNGEQIVVSKNNDLSKSMVTYDNQFHLTSGTLKNFERLASSVFTTRILGSASWDIALIVMGKIDARVWNKTKLVDIAAGCVIISEAGGKVTNFNGEPLTLNVSSAIASNGKVHNTIVGLMI